MSTSSFDLATHQAYILALGMLREVEKENFTRGWDLRIIKLISHIRPLGDIHAKRSSNSNYSRSYSSTHYTFIYGSFQQH